MLYYTKVTTSSSDMSMTYTFFDTLKWGDDGLLVSSSWFEFGGVILVISGVWK